MLRYVFIFLFLVVRISGSDPKPISNSGDLPTNGIPSGYSPYKGDGGDGGMSIEYLFSSDTPSGDSEGVDLVSGDETTVELANSGDISSGEQSDHDFTNDDVSSGVEGLPGKQSLDGDLKRSTEVRKNSSDGIELSTTVASDEQTTAVLDDGNTTNTMGSETEPERDITKTFTTAGFSASVTSIEEITSKECTTGKQCITSCKKKASGLYQNCKTCKGYIQCGNGRTFEMPCPATTVWNNKKKTCDYSSDTCVECV